MPASDRPILMGRGIVYGSYGFAVWKIDDHGEFGLRSSAWYSVCVHVCVCVSVSTSIYPSQRY